MKYIINELLISVILDGRPYNISAESPYYSEAIHLIKQNDERGIKELVDKVNQMKKYIATESANGSLKDSERITVRGNTVCLGDEVIENTASLKILSFYEKGLPFDPIAKFLHKLMQNPSKRALDGLYTFVEKFNLYIDEDGDINAWKAIREDFTDKYSGKIDNSPGQVVKVSRNKVSDDDEKGCHFGLHAGNWNYVCSFGNGNDRFILVKINPADVVCIPKCSDFEKLRCCEYIVVQEVNREEVVAFNDDVRKSKPIEETPKTPSASSSREHTILNRIGQIVEIDTLKFRDKVAFTYSELEEIQEEFFPEDKNCFDSFIGKFIRVREIVKFIKKVMYGEDVVTH